MLTRFLPGRLPEFMSLTPALIAAVMEDTLYLLLPHVTVPEGRDAIAEEAASKRTATLANIVADEMSE